MPGSAQYTVIMHFKRVHFVFRKSADYWIGLHYSNDICLAPSPHTIQNTSCWEWMNRSAVQWSNWKGGGLSNDPWKTCGYLALIDMPNTSYWLNEECDMSKSYICERPGKILVDFWYKKDVNVEVYSLKSP